MKSLERSRQLNDELSRMINVLITEYKPLKIIIFGSFVMGNINEWSDIDLVIIKDTEKSFYERLKEVIEIAEPNIAVDILVYTPKEEEELKDDLFYREEILKKGRVIYDALQ